MKLKIFAFNPYQENVLLNLTCLDFEHKLPNKTELIAQFLSKVQGQYAVMFIHIFKNYIFIITYYKRFIILQ